jgi:hypothetical protein
VVSIDAGAQKAVMVPMLKRETAVDLDMRSRRAE